MSVDRSYRLAVAARLVLAVLGGYALAALSTALFSLILPMERAEAVTAATLFSFPVMALAVLYVFATRSLRAAALGLGLPLIALSLGLWLALSVLQLGNPA